MKITIKIPTKLKRGVPAVIEMTKMSDNHGETVQSRNAGEMIYEHLHRILSNDVRLSRGRFEMSAEAVGGAFGKMVEDEFKNCLAVINNLHVALSVARSVIGDGMEEAEMIDRVQKETREYWNGTKSPAAMMHEGESDGWEAPE